MLCFFRRFTDRSFRSLDDALAKGEAAAQCIAFVMLFHAYMGFLRRIEWASPALIFGLLALQELPVGGHASLTSDLADPGLHRIWNESIYAGIFFCIGVGSIGSCLFRSEQKRPTVVNNSTPPIVDQNPRLVGGTIPVHNSPLWNPPQPPIVDPPPPENFAGKISLLRKVAKFLPWRNVHGV